MFDAKQIAHKANTDQPANRNATAKITAPAILILAFVSAQEDGRGKTAASHVNLVIMGWDAKKFAQLSL